jgi:hypothetical protein
MRLYRARPYTARGRARFPIWNTARILFICTCAFAVPGQTRALTDGAEPYAYLRLH